jgi:hypothetical protein
MDLCRYIGRRCKHALINEIRRDQAAKRREVQDHRPATVNLEDGSLYDEAVPQYYASPRKQLNDSLAFIKMHIRFASGASALTKEELELAEYTLLYRFLGYGTVRNVAYARVIGKSEGYVRKLKKSIRAKIKLGAKERREHYWNGQKHRVPAEKFVRRGKRAGKPMTIKVKK